MAVLEQLVLDGLALNDVTNYRLQGFDAPPPKKRYEWAPGGDADGSALVRDPLFENREITLRIRITQRATMDLALAAVAAITDKLEEAENQPDGLDLVWTPANGTKSFTFKVLSGEITGLPVSMDGDDAGWFKNSPVVLVTLTCKPFGYGTEVVGGSTSSATPFVTVTVASVTGDVPAEGRLIVTDAATQTRRHLEWGLEQRYYDVAQSLLVDSDNMSVTGTVGTQTTRSGAYDPNATGNNVIRGTLYGTTSVVCTTGNLGHVGTFRVKARVFAAGTGPVNLRLGWQEGDGEFGANPWVQVRTMGLWYEVDLGIVTIPPKEAGTQKWSGRIEAWGQVSDTLDVDYLILVPAAEGYGKARTIQPTQPALNLTGYDNFTTLGTGTGLNTRTANTGGTWATSGATTDFAGGSATYPGTAARSTNVAETGPRFAILGSTNYTDSYGVIYAQYAPVGALAKNHHSFLILRWVDASNYLRARWSADGTFTIETVVATVVTPIATITGGMLPNIYYQIQAFAWATGTVKATLLYANAEQFSISGTSSALATGGALATGKPGFADQALGTATTLRLYDFFSAGVPTAENPVIASTRSAEIRSDSAIRADSTNTYYGAVSSYRGSRFFVPPAGDENRTSRVLVKSNRLDVDVDAATNVTDNLTVQVAYTPRYLVVPR